MSAVASDSALQELASAAGIQIDWTDNDGIGRRVNEDTQRHVLQALHIPCATKSQIRESFALLRSEREATPDFLITRVHRPSHLKMPDIDERSARILFENGGGVDFIARNRGDGYIELPAVDIAGYHKLRIGAREIDFTVAPARCYTLDDASPGKRIYGIAAQIYGLRHAAEGDPGDSLSIRGMGSGDFGALADLVRAAGKHGADAIGLSPAHALFAGDLEHYSPYSPSSRLFLNIMLADPLATFDATCIRSSIANADLETTARELDRLDLVDWRRTGEARLKLLRALFEFFVQNELAKPDNPLARDFARFRSAGGEALEAHAQFEVLHTQEFSRDFTKWHWRTWPAEFQSREQLALQAHARTHEQEIAFHIFLQWLASRSLSSASRVAFEARMKIGLIGDLAVGLNDGGSQAWRRPGDLLQGLSIGAPPDALAPKGQDWGLAAFSPRALIAEKFSPFIDTLRATMRHCGGLRIDHVMGLARLWMIPAGGLSSGGVYLRYPLDDLLALVALESVRHRCIVIGEDLGTVPPGFREKLGANGLAGLRVLLFERDGDVWRKPETYSRDAVAMTTTHDTATFTGWQRGRDIEVRDACHQLPPGQTRKTAETERDGDKRVMARAFRAEGLLLTSHSADPDEIVAADAAITFVAKSKATLVLVPLEDILELSEQPNLPGTTVEHPNWRRRYPASSEKLFVDSVTANRLEPLNRR